MAQSRNFGFGADATMLRYGARRLLQQRAGLDSLRKTAARDHVEAYESRLQPARYDEKLWLQMVELGWPAVTVPERWGGLGMNTVAAISLAEEIGRAALPTPLTATLGATAVLSGCSGPAAGRALEAIASGEPTSSATLSETGSWSTAETGVESRAAGRGGKGFVLDGTAYFVQDARKCSSFVVSAKSEQGIGLFVVNAGAPGLQIVPDQIADLTRDQARLKFDGLELSDADVAAAPGDAPAALDGALPTLLTLLAADICGAAEWQLQTTVEYARVRKQFDRPLGFFQAVKHALVNMMLDIDRARSLVYNAACAIDEEPGNAAKFAHMAKAAASETADVCSAKSVQLHGGIGFTWECDVHLWFKRQMHSRLLLGGAAWHRQRVAELLD
jgi:alkylation response protein AidB-like acyl-CoA dehydrogenase